MLVCGPGIRDIAEIEIISIREVLSVLVNSNRIIFPKQTYYSQLEVDKFWTYVGKKSNDKHVVEKTHAVGIEGNKCRLRR